MLDIHHNGSAHRVTLLQFYGIAGQSFNTWIDLSRHESYELHDIACINPGLPGGGPSLLCGRCNVRYLRVRRNKSEHG